MTIRAAVIGVGYLGKHHARIYAELPDAELVAVVDTNRTGAEEIACSTDARRRPITGPSSMRSMRSALSPRRHRTMRSPATASQRAKTF